MHDEPTHTDAGQSGGPQFREALDRLVQIVLDGLQSRSSSTVRFPASIGKGNRRELVIEAGKSPQVHDPRGRTAALKRHR